MNVVLFGLKRAFQASINFTRPWIAALGLTAARFDMLYAIKKYSSWDRSIRQSDLRRTLGVTAPTVSRMLRSLEKLGLVVRERPRYGDTRQRNVSLTIAGRVCLRRAYRALIRRPVVQRAFNTALTAGIPGSSWLAETDVTDFICQRIRKGFGDTATLYYPWCPDD